jgi:hypothetical protein
MKTVPPNIFTLAIRILLLPGTVWLVTFPLYRLLNNEYKSQPGGVVFVGLFFFVLFLLVNVLSLLGVFKISYAEKTREVAFYSLFKSQTINVDEIAEYYLSTLETKWKDYHGYFLVLKDGSTIEITEYNTTPLRDFYAFIVQAGVPCKGSKRSLYPLRRRLRAT